MTMTHGFRRCSVERIHHLVFYKGILSETSTPQQLLYARHSIGAPGSDVTPFEIRTGTTPQRKDRDHILLQFDKICGNSVENPNATASWAHGEASQRAMAGVDTFGQ